jgi:hypothetical protein
MKKPEFTKPFNLEHAKAGAPISYEDGTPAKIIAWDRPIEVSIVSLRGDLQHVTEHYKSGGCFQRAAPNLVMLPLGFIDGKPVFVGDELEQRMAAGWVPEVAQPRWATFPANWTSEFRWPAPAPVYPETLISHVALFREYEMSLRNRGYAEISADSHGLAAVANTALRNAIDAGQVALPGAACDAARDMAVEKSTLEKLKGWLIVNNAPNWIINNIEVRIESLQEKIAGVAK